MEKGYGWRKVNGFEGISATEVGGRRSSRMAGTALINWRRLSHLSKEASLRAWGRGTRWHFKEKANWGEEKIRRACPEASERAGLWISYEVIAAAATVLFFLSFQIYNATLKERNVYIEIHRRNIYIWQRWTVVIWKKQGNKQRLVSWRRLGDYYYYISLFFYESPEKWSPSLAGYNGFFPFLKTSFNM